MKMPKKKTTDEAVVGVVTAILIVGLIVAVFSLVQTMYIPKIMEQREADHMDRVAEQFTDLTAVIDGQAANPTNTMPIATSITLGSKELPYMLSTRAYGKLEILEDTTSSIEITGIEPIQLGKITYSSMNAYFLNQNYTYEAGAMIVSQFEEDEERNFMMIPPSFFAVDSSTIHFDIVNIVSVGHKTIATGFGTYPIQTKLDDISSDSSESTIPVSNIKIKTPNTNAWSIFMSSSLNKVKCTITSVNGQYVNVYFQSPVNLIYKKININAQIGPGWVEL